MLISAWLHSVFMEIAKFDFNKFMVEKIIPKIIEFHASTYTLFHEPDMSKGLLVFIGQNGEDVGQMILSQEECLSVHQNLFPDEYENEAIIIEKEARKPNGEELYQDGISLQNERVKLWESLGYKVIAGYVHDKSDLLIYDMKDKLLKVESFKAFKLDKQRRSGSHCRTIKREDLGPEIRDALTYHVPLFLTVQNILDKSKIISFEIDPSTFDHWTTPPELASLF